MCLISVRYELGKPTGRTFTLVGNACPLTRITAFNKVPFRVPIPLEVVAPKQVVTRVYTRRPKVSKIVQNCKPKVAKSMTANRIEPVHLRDPILQLLHLLLLLSTAGYPNYSVIFGLRMLQAHDQRSLSAHQFRNVIISQVYNVEGLRHNLFSVSQFYDSDLEVAFRKHTCFVCNLEGVDLLSRSRGTNLYSLSIGDIMASSPICLLSKATKTKSWLWHRRLSHLNFGAINHLGHGLVRGLPRLKFEKDHLCSACAMGKSKKQSHKPKSEDTNQEKLYLLHMDLCGPMRVASVNGKKYILLNVDDYSQFTWVKFLASKDEAPDFIIKFLKMIQIRLNATVRNIRTDNGTEFVNQTLRDYYEQVGISHKTLVAQTAQQNGVVERRNRTLVEVARTMLIYAKAPLFLWAEAVAIACYTENQSIIRCRHGKTPYELLHDRKPDLSYLHLTAMASEQSSLEPALHEMTPATPSSGLVPNPPPSAPFVPPSRHEWDLVFQPVFDEFFSPPASVASPVPVEEAPAPVESTGSPSLTTVDQDAPSPNALTQSCWIEAMQEELHEFEHLKVWELVPRLDKVMEERIDFEESFALVARLEAIRIFLALKKALYGLKQAPRAWYDLLSSFLLSQGFIKGTVDLTLFISKKGKDILLWRNPNWMRIHKGKAIDPINYRGMVAPLMYLTSSRPDLYVVCMCARFQARPTEKHLHDVTRIFRYLRRTVNRVLWYSKDSAIPLTAFADADYAVENGVIELYFVRMKYQLADIFTKALCRERIEFHIDKLGMRSFTSETLNKLAHEAEE
ncbi:retrovirus-related pol polyprotein from transposon TNT 1-94 [Tanacetum coccineum]